MAPKRAATKKPAGAFRRVAAKAAAKRRAAAKPSSSSSSGQLRGVITNPHLPKASTLKRPSYMTVDAGKHPLEIALDVTDTNFIFLQSNRLLNVNGFAPEFYKYSKCGTPFILNGSVLPSD